MTCHVHEFDAREGRHRTKSARMKVIIEAIWVKKSPLFARCRTPSGDFATIDSGWYKLRRGGLLWQYQ
jgi:hypothetical protein